MNISFRKKNGIPALGIEFFWRMAIDAKPHTTLTDHFIPELFYDYFFVREGKIKCRDEKATEFTLHQQSLKTLHTHPLTFTYLTPLILFGARFSTAFAESFWKSDIKANSFLAEEWVSQNTCDLESFAGQISEYIEKHRIKKMDYPMFSAELEESDWLANFSLRHKRRLYKTAFGLSRKELQNIQNIHSFLEQTCDFTSQNPRIIQHVNPDVFYDQPHLNHIFKKITGFSPVEYFQANSILQDNLMSASYNDNFSV